MSFYSDDELQKMGFKKCGKRVRVSRKASLYGVERIQIGDDSRIDDFCVLSAGEGGIEIGRHVHIAVFCSLIGQSSIVLSDFSGLSSRVAVYSSTDDYSGKALTNPTVPAEYLKILSAPVMLDKHVIVGAGAVILPGCHLYEGAAVGALSLVTKDCESFMIYSGVPARPMKARSRTLLDLEEQLNQKELG